MHKYFMMNFNLWLIENNAFQIMENFYKSINEVLDQYGNDIKLSNLRKKFESEKDGKTYIKGFQGYKQHNPMIRGFASQTPENFAQTVLFGPLTANTNFARFNEWFPVLMSFLRKHDTVTAEMVGNFAASIHSQRKGIPGGGLFVSIIDRGERHKTKLIEYVWNNREQLKKECDDLAKKGQFKDLLHKFALMPGIQPVKAGFIVQLLYGQMGCLDTHNIAMYSDLANQMQNDLSLSKDTREKWKELGNRLREGSKTWIKSAAKGEEAPAWQLDRAVTAYHNILNFMDQNMGLSPRVLWDLWCNYVAQRYSHKKAYSMDQGVAYSPDDEELHNVLGGKDRQWINPKTKIPTDIIRPHLASGAVSRVHLMAAITPDQLFDELQKQSTNKFHMYNAALRTDLDVKSALQVLSNRLHDAEEIKNMIATGGRVNAAIKSAKEHNLKLLEKLTDNAKKALKVILQHKYPTLKPAEVDELVNLYTNAFGNLYKLHTKEVLSSIKGQDTMLRKNKGIFVHDDEEEGFGQYGYDPDAAFNINSRNPDIQKKANSRIKAVTNRLEPYEPEFIASAQSSLTLKKVEKELEELQQKLREMKDKWKTDGYESFGGKEKYIKRRDHLAEKIKSLKDKVSSLKDIHKTNINVLSKKAGAELAAQKAIQGERLHGPRKGAENIADDEYYDDEL